VIPARLRRSASTEVVIPAFLPSMHRWISRVGLKRMSGEPGTRSMPAITPRTAPLSAQVQGGGAAWRMEAATFCREIQRSTALQTRPEPLHVCNTEPIGTVGRSHPLPSGRGATCPVALDDSRSGPRRPVLHHARVPGLYAWRAACRCYTGRQFSGLDASAIRAGH
jgi:hypothetical protein